MINGGWQNLLYLLVKKVSLSHYDELIIAALPQKNCSFFAFSKQLLKLRLNFFLYFELSLKLNKFKQKLSFSLILFQVIRTFVRCKNGIQVLFENDPNLSMKRVYHPRTSTAETLTKSRSFQRQYIFV